MVPPRQLSEGSSSTPPTKPTTSPAKKLTDLPEEVLEHIFKYSALARGSRWGGVEHYLAVALTSKQFHRIILPLNRMDRDMFAEAVYCMQHCNGKETERH
jgi:hypothetical protein